MQAEHDGAAAPPQHLANADAVPLFLAALRAAGPGERRWGLALWASLLRDSMANLSACDRYSFVLHLSSNLQKTL